MSRKLMMLVLSPVFAAALGFGIAWDSGSPTLQPQPVYAACKAPNGLCGNPPGADLTKTSVMTAQYLEFGVDAVLPTAGTTWNITANWSTIFPGCADLSETASVTVTWNSGASAWALSNTNLTANIVGIGLCNTSACGSAAAGYTLYVDIYDPANGNYNLTSVDYASSGSLPNGTRCLGGSVSPISGSVSGTDNGGWSSRCAYNCSYSNGPVIPIYYQ